MTTETEKPQRPEYISENDDGTVTIGLRSGAKISGAVVKALQMREPTVADQIAVSAMQGGDAAKEVALFANLCSVTPEEIKSLTMRDYTRVQQGYRCFFD